MMDSLVTSVIALAGLGLAMWSSGIPMRIHLRNYLAFSWLLAATFLLHFLLDDGRIWATIPWLGWPLSVEGFEQGCLYCGRILFLIGFSNLLMLTTTPGDLAEAMERLMKPLRRLGMPTGEIGLMVGLALRFIPTIFEEGQRIRLAQRARGSEHNHSFRKRLTNLASVVIPLYLSVFRRAHDLALAMEARGYVPGAPRSCYRVFALRSVDYAMLGVVTVFLGGLAAAG